MAEGANQHYVPQFYFRQFSPDGKRINLLTRKNGKVVTGASIKGQASRRYFYGPSANEQQMQIIDAEFSRTAQMVRQARDYAELSNDQWYVFLQCMMVQRSRTLAARISGSPIMDKLTRLQLEIDIRADDALSGKEREQLIESIPDLGANPLQTQAILMSSAVEAAEFILDLIPVILLNKTNRPFIFSDAPVVFLNLQYQKIKLRGVLGADTPGLIVAYPLGPHKLLMLFDAAAYGVKGAANLCKSVKSLKDIAELNKIQIHAAANTIYFSDDDISSYVHLLWRQESKHLQNHEGNVVEAPGYDSQGEELGEVLHSFQPQLPFVPQLSFLRYAILEEKDYRFSRRSS